MADIESIGLALVCKVGTNHPLPQDLKLQDGHIAIRSEMRALSGMQKEALIYNGLTGAAWRMVSDEGPYLKRTCFLHAAMRGSNASKIQIKFNGDLLDL